MPHPQWLERVLSISEDTPYHSIICTPNGQGLSIKGDAVFNLENGSLTFQLFLDNEEPYTAGHEAFAVSQGTDPQLILNILSRDFSYPARIVSTPVRKATGERTTIRGFIESPHYGSATTALKNVNIWLRGVPTGWFGNEKWTHYYGVTPELIRYKQSGEAIIPDRRWLSVVSLSGFTLKTNGWTTTIREIPANDRPDPEVAHLCLITRSDDTLTGESVQEFLEEDLHPFLCFIFGRRIRYDQITGADWAIIPAHGTTTSKTIGRNWFLSSGNRIDPAPLFQSFCRLPQDVKTHWRKVIQQYIASEEIIGTLDQSAIAASVSFAALEGLTRSIISTYPDADQWLSSDLSLKRGKGIVNAIEMVARREFAPHSEVFRKASDEIKKVRNDTMHVDLKSDEDWQNAYHRWNSSQALIEILLLGKMGLTQIPNRTSHGTFQVMGKDMYEEVRQEELNFL